MQYSIDKVKNEIKDLINKAGLKGEIEVETPPKNLNADFAVPFFKFAKICKKKPDVLAMEIKEKIDLINTVFERVERNGCYLNFYLKKPEFNKLVISDFNKLKEKYGTCFDGKDKTIVIDYSSPNIAKPFSIGHLRSTVIGQAIYNIYKSLGYRVIGDNHLGDWGTQFGKLIFAYKKWGDKAKLQKDPMNESLRIYVKFHDEVKKDKKLIDEAREWFKKLEEGDKKAHEIWELFSKLSINEFNKIYEMLDIKFDETLGESFYSDKTDEIITLAKKKNIAKWETALDEDGKPSKSGDKVLLVDLKKYGIDTPLLLQKSDGTTLYATRDLAAIKFRINKWKPDKILYIVGAEQKLYFKQLFQVAKLIGFKSELVHVDFGLIRLPEGKMSTREGKVILLENVLSDAIKKVADIINERDINKAEKEEISNIIGIGAIKYADLSQSRNKDIIFDWNKIVTLKGNSGPYLQYQFVRIQSILKKSAKGISKINSALLTSQEEINLIKKISEFNEILKKVLNNLETHVLTDYLYDLSELFSTFYEKCPVIQAPSKELKASRQYLCQITSQVLKNGLSLLGIKCPEKM